MADQFSDVSMYEMKDGHIRVQYILENEVQAKARTVLRKAGYEGALYRRQMENDETFPIVSLLLYWGLISWNQPVSMREFFQKADIDQSTWKYITNEKLHVYTMARLPKQVRNRFRSDMRIVVDYLAERQNYKPTTQKLIHPEALLLMLKALTNDERYIEMLTALTEEEKKGGLQCVNCWINTRTGEYRRECKKGYNRVSFAWQPSLKNYCSQTVWMTFKKLSTIRTIETGYMKN